MPALNWSDIADLFEAGEQLADYADDYAASLRETWDQERIPANIDSCIGRWKTALASIHAALTDNVPADNYNYED